MQDERNQLGVKLTEITSKFTSERNRNYDLTAKLESLERDLWFKIKLLTSELEVEREKSQSRTQVRFEVIFIFRKSVQFQLHF